MNKKTIIRFVWITIFFRLFYLLQTFVESRFFDNEISRSELTNWIFAATAALAIMAVRYFLHGDGSKKEGRQD